jgi:glycosyltransferase involved in cell wall biosynthesis
MFVAVSDFLRTKMIATGLSPERVQTRRNFCWGNTPRAGAGDYFLSLGRLSDEKGLSVTITAVGSNPYLIVGDGPERSRLSELARPNTRLLGALEPAAVQPLLRQARALLLPSRCYEGCPRAVLEALALGVPVVASSIGGLPELVEDGVNGLLVPPDDRDAWADAIERLLDNSEAESMGKSAFASWQARFSPEVALDRLLALYSEVASSR